MKAGQITAKLRDAVPVCFFTDGDEVTRYRNIDIPDSLKELDIMDFGFDVAMDGKITFRLFFGDGILPAVFPPIREKMTRAEKAAAKAVESVAVEPEEAPAIPEYRFNVTGKRRNELVAAIGVYLDQQVNYLGAPSFAYAIGAYRIDKTGTLIGEPSPELLAALVESGFIPAESDAA